MRSQLKLYEITFNTYTTHLAFSIHIPHLLTTLLRFQSTTISITSSPSSITGGTLADSGNPRISCSMVATHGCNTVGIMLILSSIKLFILLRLLTKSLLFFHQNILQTTNRFVQGVFRPEMGVTLVVRFEYVSIALSHCLLLLIP